MALPQGFGPRRSFADVQRQQLANQLLAQGGDSSPVQHEMQGVARLAQALMGGYLTNRNETRENERQQAFSQAVTEAMQPQFVPGAAGAGPRSGPEGATMAPPSFGQVAQNLARRPETAHLAPQFTMMDLQQQAANAARGRYEPVMGEDGRTPIGQRNTVTGKIEPMPQGDRQPDEVRAYQFAKSQGFTGSFLDFQKEQAAARTNAGQENWGLIPQVAQDAQGNPVLLQFSNRGAVRSAPLPQGVAPAPWQTSRLDLGTEWAIQDRNGNIIQRIPKDIAGAEREKVVGTQRGEQITGAPDAARQANQMLTSIEGILNDRSLPMATGALSVLGNIPGTPMRGFAARADQLQGQAFLQAFESLKGGGAITETEGQKATQAIARLDRAQQPSDYRAALEELRGIVSAARDRAMSRIPEDQRASVLPPAQQQRQTAPAAQPRTQAPAAPQPGAVVDGWRFRGGNPADQANWERAR